MLDMETSNLLSNVAAQTKRSLSAMAAELIREALELHEDQLLSKHGDERVKETKRWLSHEEAWK